MLKKEEHRTKDAILGSKIMSLVLGSFPSNWSLRSSVLTHWWMNLLIAWSASCSKGRTTSPVESTYLPVLMCVPEESERQLILKTKLTHVNPFASDGHQSGNSKWEGIRRVGKRNKTLTSIKSYLMWRQKCWLIVTSVAINGSSSVKGSCQAHYHNQQDGSTSAVILVFVFQKNLCQQWHRLIRSDLPHRRTQRTSNLGI